MIGLRMRYFYKTTQRNTNKVYSYRYPICIFHIRINLKKPIQTCMGFYQKLCFQLFGFYQAIRFGFVIGNKRK